MGGLQGVIPTQGPYSQLSLSSRASSTLPVPHPMPQFIMGTKTILPNSRTPTFLCPAPTIP